MKPSRSDLLGRVNHIADDIGIDRLSADELTRVERNTRNTFVEAVDLRIEQGERFQLPVTEHLDLVDGTAKVQALPGSRKFIDPVATDVTQRQPLLRRGNEYYSSIRTRQGAELLSGLDAGAADVSGQLNLLQQPDLLGEDRVTTAAYLDLIDNLDSVGESFAAGWQKEKFQQKLRGLSEEQRTSLTNQLSERHASAAESASADTLNSQSRAAGWLLDVDLETLSGQMSEEEVPGRALYERINTLATVSENGFFTLMINNREGTQVGIDVILDPSIRPEASFGRRDADVVYIGTGGDDYLTAATLHLLLDEMVNPTLKNENLIAPLHLRLDPAERPEQFSFRELSGRLKIEPGRIAVSTGIDRVKVAIGLANHLTERGLDSAAARLRQSISNALFYLDNIATGNGWSEGDEDQGIHDVGDSRLQGELQKIDRSTLPPPESESLLRFTCTKRAASCTAAGLAINELDAAHEQLDEAIKSEELVAARAHGEEGNNLILKQGFRAVDQHRLASVAAINPVDNPKFQSELIKVILEQVMHPERSSSPADVIDHVVKHFEKQGYAAEAEYIRTHLVDNPEFLKQLGELNQVGLGQKKLAEVATAGEIKNIRLNSIRTRLARLNESKAARKINAFSQKSYVENTQHAFGVGQAVFGVAQSSVALANLIRYNDVLSPETKATGYTGVALGYTGSTFGLATSSNRILAKSLGVTNEAGVLGGSLRLGAKSSARLARFLSVVGAVISIAAGVFAATTDIMAAKDAAKYGNKDQEVFYAIQATFDIIGIILDAVSLVLDFVLPPAAWAVDIIATVLTVAQTFYGFFAPPTNARQDWHTLLESGSVDTALSAMADKFTQEGYRRFEIYYDAAQFLSEYDYGYSLRGEDYLEQFQKDLSGESKGTALIDTTLYGKRYEGTEHDDFFSTTETEHIIDGLGGNDIIILHDYTGTAYGGEGDDTISYGRYQYGGDGNDQLIHSLGAVTVDAGEGDDSISPGTGYVNINGGAGKDTLYLPNPQTTIEDYDAVNFHFFNETYSVDIGSNYIFNVNFATHQLTNGLDNYLRNSDNGFAFTGNSVDDIEIPARNVLANLFNVSEPSATSLLSSGCRYNRVNCNHIVKLNYGLSANRFFIESAQAISDPSQATGDLEKRKVLGLISQSSTYKYRNIIDDTYLTPYTNFVDLNGSGDDQTQSYVKQVVAGLRSAGKQPVHMGEVVVAKVSRVRNRIYRQKQYDDTHIYNKDNYARSDYDKVGGYSDADDYECITLVVFCCVSNPFLCKWNCFPREDLFDACKIYDIRERDVLNYDDIHKGTLIATNDTYHLVSNRAFVTYPGNNKYLHWTISLDDLKAAASDNGPSHLYAQFLDLANTKGTVRNVENLICSRYPTHFVGDEQNNLVMGVSGRNRFDTAAGRDTVYAGDQDEIINTEQDDDVIFLDTGTYRVDGGSGRDTVSYQRRKSGVSADLRNRDLSNGDVLQNIEVFQGTYYDDTLIGDDGDNYIVPFNGTNLVYGMGGNDTFILEGGMTTVETGRDNNTVVIGDGVHRILGGPGRDQILFRDSTHSQHFINGSLGEDTLGTTRSVYGIHIEQENTITKKWIPFASLDFDFAGETITHRPLYLSSSYLYKIFWYSYSFTIPVTPELQPNKPTSEITYRDEPKKERTQTTSLQSEKSWNWKDLGFENTAMSDYKNYLLENTRMSSSPAPGSSSEPPKIFRYTIQLRPSPVEIDLNACHSIEAAMGHLGTDTITGHGQEDNTLIGRGGDDILSGQGGNNHYLTGMGNARITGANGTDVIFYNSGAVYQYPYNHDFQSQSGDEGTTHWHRSRFHNFTLSSISVNYDAENSGQVNHTWAARNNTIYQLTFTDTFQHINAIIGTPYQDQVSGSDAVDEFISGGGADQVYLGAGDDSLTLTGNWTETGGFLDGGNDTDTLIFQSEHFSRGIYLDLASKTLQLIPDGQSDLSYKALRQLTEPAIGVRGFETVIGSNHQRDVFFGDQLNNQFQLINGSHQVYGRGGSDYFVLTSIRVEDQQVIHGGTGTDVVDYRQINYPSHILEVLSRQGSIEGITVTFPFELQSQCPDDGEVLPANTTFAGCARGTSQLLSYDRVASGETDLVLRKVHKETLYDVEVFVGTPFNDDITLPPISNATAFGGFGNDTLSGWGDVYLYGEDGDDLLIAGAREGKGSISVGGPGHDRHRGSSADDSMSADIDSDEMYGGNGRDTYFVDTRAMGSYIEDTDDYNNLILMGEGVRRGNFTLDLNSDFSQLHIRYNSSSLVSINLKTVPRHIRPDGSLGTEHFYAGMVRHIPYINIRDTARINENSSRLTPSALNISPLDITPGPGNGTFNSTLPANATVAPEPYGYRMMYDVLWSFYSTELQHDLRLDNILEATAESPSVDGEIGNDVLLAIGLSPDTRINATASDEMVNGTAPFKARLSGGTGHDQFYIADFSATVIPGEGHDYVSIAGKSAVEIYQAFDEQTLKLDLTGSKAQEIRANSWEPLYWVRHNQTITGYPSGSADYTPQQSGLSLPSGTHTYGELNDWVIENALTFAANITLNSDLPETLPLVKAESLDNHWSMEWVLTGNQGLNLTLASHSDDQWVTGSVDRFFTPDSATFAAVAINGTGYVSLYANGELKAEIQGWMPKRNFRSYWQFGNEELLQASSPVVFDHVVISSQKATAEDIQFLSQSASGALIELSTYCQPHLAKLSFWPDHLITKDGVLLDGADYIRSAFTGGRLGSIKPVPDHLYIRDSASGEWHFQLDSGRRAIGQTAGSADLLIIDVDTDKQVMFRKRVNDLIIYRVENGIDPRKLPLEKIADQLLVEGYFGDDQGSFNSVERIELGYHLITRSDVLALSQAFPDVEHWLGLSSLNNIRLLPDHDDLLVYLAEPESFDPRFRLAAEWPLRWHNYPLHDQALQLTAWSEDGEGKGDEARTAGLTAVDFLGLAKATLWKFQQYLVNGANGFANNNVAGNVTGNATGEFEAGADNQTSTTVYELSDFPLADIQLLPSVFAYNMTSGIEFADNVFNDFSSDSGFIRVGTDQSDQYHTDGHTGVFLGQEGDDVVTIRDFDWFYIGLGNGTDTLVFEHNANVNVKLDAVSGELQADGRQRWQTGGVERYRWASAGTGEVSVGGDLREIRVQNGFLEINNYDRYLKVITDQPGQVSINANELSGWSRVRCDASDGVSHLSLTALGNLENQLSTELFEPVRAIASLDEGKGLLLSSGIQPLQQGGRTGWQLAAGDHGIFNGYETGGNMTLAASLSLASPDTGNTGNTESVTLFEFNDFELGGLQVEVSPNFALTVTSHNVSDSASVTAERFFPATGHSLHMAITMDAEGHIDIYRNGLHKVRGNLTPIPFGLRTNNTLSRTEGGYFRGDIYSLVLAPLTLTEGDAPLLRQSGNGRLARIKYNNQEVLGEGSRVGGIDTIGCIPVAVTFNNQTTSFSQLNERYGAHVLNEEPQEPEIDPSAINPSSSFGFWSLSESIDNSIDHSVDVSTSSDYVIHITMSTAVVLPTMSPGNGAEGEEFVKNFTFPARNYTHTHTLQPNMTVPLFPERPLAPVRSGNQSNSTEVEPRSHDLDLVLGDDWNRIIDSPCGHPPCLPVEYNPNNVTDTAPDGPLSLRFTTEVNGDIAIDLGAGSINVNQTRHWDIAGVRDLSWETSSGGTLFGDAEDNRLIIGGQSGNVTVSGKGGLDIVKNFSPNRVKYLFGRGNDLDIIEDYRGNSELHFNDDDVTFSNILARNISDVIQLVLMEGADVYFGQSNQMVMIPMTEPNITAIPEEAEIEDYTLAGVGSITAGDKNLSGDQIGLLVQATHLFMNTTTDVGVGHRLPANHSVYSDILNNLIWSAGGHN